MNREKLEIMIMVGDIIMMNHLGENNEFLRHPFLVIETNKRNFVALQCTAPKADKFEKILLEDSEFISKIYDFGEYVECDREDGFEYITWVLLTEIYEVKYNEMKECEVEKISSFNNDSKLEEIIEQYQN